MSEREQRWCSRCRGCGQLGGWGASERPWNTFEKLPAHQALQKIMGMQQPRPCPDCDGTGLSRFSAA